MPKRRGKRHTPLGPYPKRKLKPNNRIELVKFANQEKDLLGKVPDLKMFKSAYTGETFKIICISYKNCSEEIFDCMMSLLEENMSALYESCGWGWNYSLKKEEMAAENSRFIIAVKADNEELVAFSHFKFDMDNSYNVVYCYELQVNKSARKIGLAKHIMHVLDSLSSFFSMEKVVLTVLKNNVNAYNFFCSLGFTLDESSPQFYSIQSCYSILSKTNNSPKLLLDEQSGVHTGV